VQPARGAADGQVLSVGYASRPGRPRLAMGRLHNSGQNPLSAVAFVWADARRW
jgi:hypothetical protein